MKRSDAAFQLGGSGIRTLHNARIQPPRAANNTKFNLHARQSSKQLRFPAVHPQCTPHTMILKLSGAHRLLPWRTVRERDTVIQIWESVGRFLFPPDPRHVLNLFYSTVYSVSIALWVA